jgi:hypothetical protein
MLLFGWIFRVHHAAIDEQQLDPSMFLDGEFS